MGTRADFYVGRGEGMEWLGSIAYDGYPDGNPEKVIKATTESEYRALVEEMTALDCGVCPADGWPWPWKTSHTTDFAYAFVDGKVHASCFGGPWFDPLKPKPSERGGTGAVFPDMSERQKVTLGKRSGVLILAEDE